MTLEPLSTPSHPRHSWFNCRPLCSIGIRLGATQIRREKILRHRFCQWLFYYRGPRWTSFSFRNFFSIGCLIGYTLTNEQKSEWLILDRSSRWRSQATFTEDVLRRKCLYCLHDLLIRLKVHPQVTYQFIQRYFNKTDLLSNHTTQCCFYTLSLFSTVCDENLPVSCRSSKFRWRIRVAKSLHPNRWIRLTWTVFGKINYISKNKDIPMKLKGKVYDNCVLPVAA